MAAPGPTQAVLIVTVTHDWGPPAPISQMAMGGGVRFHVELQGAGIEGGRTSLPSLTDPGFSSMFVQTPFDQLWGRYHVRTLPPGTYQFVNWRLYRSTGVGFVNHEPRQPPPPISITLAAGTVTYVGNIHAELSWSKNAVGLTALSGGTPTVRNEAERDLKLITQAYPQLQGRVDIRPLPAGPWERADTP